MNPLQRGALPQPCNSMPIPSQVRPPTGGGEPDPTRPYPTHPGPTPPCRTEPRGARLPLYYPSLGATHLGVGEPCLDLPVLPCPDEPRLEGNRNSPSHTQPGLVAPSRSGNLVPRQTVPHRIQPGPNPPDLGESCLASPNRTQPVGTKPRQARPDKPNCEEPHQTKNGPGHTATLSRHAWTDLASGNRAPSHASPNRCSPSPTSGNRTKPHRVMPCHTRP